MGDTIPTIVKCRHGGVSTNRGGMRSEEMLCSGAIRRVPDLHFFGFKKSYWFSWCCANMMECHKEVQIMQCSVCGKNEEYLICRIAVCPVCGWTKGKGLGY